jgi:methionyl-tRNA formyltransferase
VSEPLSLIFAGTPEFSVPALEALCASRHRVLAVYTQPDRPAGRGRRVVASPVKSCALRHGLPVAQPASLRAPDALEKLAQWRADLMVVVAYGLLLPEAALNAPRRGCVNIHASLLPRWRGAAPIQRAILAGDRLTGVAIMQMDAGLDTGPVLLQRATPIGERETAASLHDRLAVMGAQALIEALDMIAAGVAHPRPQPDEGITYAHKIRKEEAVIDWSRPAVEIDRQVRAFNPWPIAQTLWRGRQLRIWEAEPLACPSSAPAAPGTVLASCAQGIDVATGNGVLRITRLQEPGRKPLSAAEFVNAHDLGSSVLGAES